MAADARVQLVILVAHEIFAIETEIVEHLAPERTEGHCVYKAVASAEPVTRVSNACTRLCEEGDCFRGHRVGAGQRDAATAHVGRSRTLQFSDTVLDVIGRILGMCIHPDDVS